MLVFVFVLFGVLLMKKLSIFCLLCRLEFFSLFSIGRGVFMKLFVVDLIRMFFFSGLLLKEASVLLFSKGFKKGFIVAERGSFFEVFSSFSLMMFFI